MDGSVSSASSTGEAGDVTETPERSVREGDDSIDTEETSPSPSSQSSAAATGTWWMVGDATILLAGAATAFALQRVLRSVSQTVVLDHLALFVLGLPFFVGGAALSGLHRGGSHRGGSGAGPERPTGESVLRTSSRVVVTVAIGVGGIISLAFAWDYDELSRLWVLVLAAVITGGMIAARVIARWTTAA